MGREGWVWRCGGHTCGMGMRWDTGAEARESAAWAEPQRACDPRLGAPGSHGRIQSRGGIQTCVARELHVSSPAIASPFPASQPHSGYACFLRIRKDKEKSSPWGEPTPWELGVQRSRHVISGDQVPLPHMDPMRTWGSERGSTQPTSRSNIARHPISQTEL